MKVVARRVRSRLRYRVATCGICVLWMGFSNFSCRAEGDVYAHVDAVSGMIVLNNVPPSKREAAVSTQRVKGQKQATGATLGRISPARQQEMDVDRHAILQDELNEEQRKIASAYANHAAGDVLARHIANIAALQRELARLKGRQLE